MKQYNVLWSVCFSQYVGCKGTSNNVCRIPARPWAAPRYFLSCHSNMRGHGACSSLASLRPDTRIASHTCQQKHTRRHTIKNTVEAVLKDHPIGHKNVVCQDRWSLLTGSVILKCRSFCPKCVVFQDRWSLKTGFTVLSD